MKRLMTLLLGLTLCAFSVPSRAEPPAATPAGDKVMAEAGDDKDDLDVGKGIGKACSAETMITRMRERKDKVLQQMRNRFSRMSERLGKMEGRSDRMRQRARRRQGPEIGSGSAAAGEDRAAVRKARIMEKYEKFKAMIAQRKAKVGDRRAESPGGKARQSAEARGKGQGDGRVRCRPEGDRRRGREDPGRGLDQARSRLPELPPKVIR